jgi:hypothetical protein
LFNTMLLNFGLSPTTCIGGEGLIKSPPLTLVCFVHFCLASLMKLVLL